MLLVSFFINLDFKGEAGEVDGFFQSRVDSHASKVFGKSFFDFVAWQSVSATKAKLTYENFVKKGYILDFAVNREPILWGTNQ